MSKEELVVLANGQRMGRVLRNKARDQLRSKLRAEGITHGVVDRLADGIADRCREIQKTAGER